jgi:hypothetical protein
MKWSAKSRTREPLDRRQMRLVQALLAFPAAGIIGFTGNTIVKNVRSEPPPIASPATPRPVTDDQPSSDEHEDGREPAGDDTHVMRNV